VPDNIPPKDRARHQAIINQQLKALEQERAQDVGSGGTLAGTALDELGKLFKGMAPGALDAIFGVPTEMGQTAMSAVPDVSDALGRQQLETSQSLHPTAANIGTGLAMLTGLIPGGTEAATGVVKDIAQNVLPSESGRVGLTKVYHGTRTKGFDVPTEGYEGVHVGNPDVAEYFAGPRYRGGSGEGGRVIPLWAKVEKELRTTDPGAWTPGHLLRATRNTKALPMDLQSHLEQLASELEHARETGSFSSPLSSGEDFPTDFYATQRKLLHDIFGHLQDQGYDAIAYPNAAEGRELLRGSPQNESMIIFNPIENLKNALQHPTPEEAFPGSNLPVQPPLGSPVPLQSIPEWLKYNPFNTPGANILGSGLLAGLGKSLVQPRNNQP
jgi:hypothetical protein